MVVFSTQAERRERCVLIMMDRAAVDCLYPTFCLPLIVSSS